jgi:hypothetical protein
MKRYSLTETAKMIRHALAVAFPETKFSVRSKSYSGGCSITAAWTDGPVGRDVNPILKRFEGAGFDGMTDCKTYNPSSEWNGEPCEFAADYVFANRHTSAVLLQMAAYRVHKETKLPLLEVRDGNLFGGEYQVPFSYFAEENILAHGESQRVKGGEWYSQLVYQVCRNTATATKQAEPSLPTMVTPEFIAAKLEGMIQ